ncbi:hypothetical protein D3C87_1986220 [compost metagenome]
MTTFLLKIELGREELRVPDDQAVSVQEHEGVCSDVGLLICLCQLLVGLQAHFSRRHSSAGMELLPGLRPLAWSVHRGTLLYVLFVRFRRAPEARNLPI